MIFIASVFRNSESYIDRYVEQVAAFRDSTHVPVHVIAVEGDSNDETYKMLLDEREFDTVLVCEHGGPPFESIDHQLRWRQLSVACNVALCAAIRMSQPDDFTIYVESDLIVGDGVFQRLIDDLDSRQAVAPMSMQGNIFYDVWGHRQTGGEQFHHYPSYYEGWHVGTEEMIVIESAGSCFALTHDALQVVEFGARDCIRGIGRTLRENGYELWLDPTIHVEHPK